MPGRRKAVITEGASDAPGRTQPCTLVAAMTFVAHGPPFSKTSPDWPVSADDGGESWPGQRQGTLPSRTRPRAEVEEHDGAGNQPRRSHARSCRPCLGRQRSVHLTAATVNVAARPVPDGQRTPAAGSAQGAGGLDRAGGPARPGAADHGVASRPAGLADSRAGGPDGRLAIRIHARGRDRDGRGRGPVAGHWHHPGHLR